MMLSRRLLPHHCRRFSVASPAVCFRRRNVGIVIGGRDSDDDDEKKRSNNVIASIRRHSSTIGQRDRPTVSMLNDPPPLVVPARRIQDSSFYATSRFSSTSSSSTTDERAEEVAASSSSSNASPSILPGIALSAITAGAGFGVACLISSATSIALSGIPVSIVLGMAVNNTFGYDRSAYRPGITYATKTILQSGIVAVAAKLSFVELAHAGAAGLPVVLSALGAGMLYVPMAGRMAGLNSETTLLLTAGTSICGVTAITALAPAIKASNRDIAVAVANTVAFGTIGMLAYPYIYHTICLSPEQVGVCLGVSIHDTSQVLGGAMSYNEMYPGEEAALRTAAVTKLTRNLGLMAAIPGLTYVHHASSLQESSNDNNKSSTKEEDVAATTKNEQRIGETVSGLVSFQKYVPPFLVAFLGMSALRTTGDYALASETIVAASSADLANAFTRTMDFIGNDISKCALGTAMAGVGLSTSMDSLKGVGWRPFAVGGSGALVVGATGYAVSSMVM